MRLFLMLTALSILMVGLPAAEAINLPGGEPVELLERADNFELVGHTPLNSRGMNAALAVYGDYAYVGSRTDGKPQNRNLLGSGVLVVDISDPADPQVVNEIGAPDQGTQDQTSREMRIWPEAELLIVENLASNCSELIHACSPVGGRPDHFAFYDISGENAADPVKVAEYDPTSNPHEFYLWADPADSSRALMFISATGSNELIVTDISGARDSEFTELTKWGVPIPGGDLHSMTPTADGRELHLAYLTGGYYIADTSDIIDGVPDAEPTLITPAGNGADWPGPGAHSTLRIPGSDYAFAADEVYGEALRALGGHGCPWGWVRTIDISDRTTPTVAAEYKIAQNEQDFCATDVPRPSSSFSAHNPTLTDQLAFITWHSGGLQAIDLSDPAAPTSAGSYYPDPLPAVVIEDPALSAERDKVVMWSFPIIQDGLIYVVDLRNGLYVLRYTGDGSDIIDSIDFLEGNSNLADALRFDPVESADEP